MLTVKQAFRRTIAPESAQPSDGNSHAQWLPFAEAPLDQNFDHAGNTSFARITAVHRLTLDGWDLRMDETPYKSPQVDDIRAPDDPKPTKFSKLEIVGLLLFGPVPLLFYRNLGLALVLFLASLFCFGIGRFMRPPSRQYSTVNPSRAPHPRWRRRPWRYIAFPIWCVIVVPVAICCLPIYALDSVKRRRVQSRHDVRPH